MLINRIKPCLTSLCSLALLVGMNQTSPAASIVQQDVTSSLSGTIFMDDAVTGGGDATVHDDTAGGAGTDYNRNFDLDGDGLIGAPGLTGTITIDDFGFATSGTATANDASSVTFTFSYLGADEIIGGGDDVLLGSESVSYTHVGAGEYYVAFDTPITGTIDGLGDRFSINVNVDDNDGGLQESIRFKSNPLAYETFSGAKFSASGSFVLDAISWNVDGPGVWNTATNWDPNTVPGVGGASGGSVLLGNVATSAITVTLNTSPDLSSLVFDNTNGYTLTDGGGSDTLTLSGTAFLSAGSGAHIVDAEITGSSGLNKVGGGTITLSGTNTYTGTTSIQAGTLAISADSNLGNASNGIDLQNGGVLRVEGTSLSTLARSITLTSNGTINVDDPTHEVEVTGAVSGAGLFVKAGEGTLNLDDASGITGDIHVNVGTLVVDNNDGLGDATGVTKVDAGGGTVELDGSGGNLTLAENFERLQGRFEAVPESHIVNSAGDNTLTGELNASGDAFSNVRIEAAAGTELTINNTTLTPATLYDADDEDLRFVFQGAGDITIGDSSTPDSGKIVGSSIDVVVAMDDPSATVTIGTAVNSLDTSNATGYYWGGVTTIESGTLAVLSEATNTQGELATSRIDVQSGATFDISDFSSYSLQVVTDPDQSGSPNGDETGQLLSGAGTVNTGSGTLNFFEDSRLAPGDSAGTLNVTGNMSINMTQANPNGYFEYELSNSASGTNDELDVSNTLTLSQSTDGTFNLNIIPVNGNLDSSAYTIMSAGSLVNSGSSVSPSDFVIALQNEQGAALNTRQDDSIAVAINSTSVTVTFSPAESSNWTGATNGTWDIGATSNWSSSDNLFFDLDSVSFGDGTGQTNVNISGAVNPGGMTFSNSTDTFTFTGDGIQGSAAMNLNPGAKVVLANNANGFTGGTNISAGATLTLGDGTSALGQLADGSSVANEGTLAFNRSGYGFFTQVISGSGVVQIDSGYTDFNGVNTYSGGTTINGGTLRMRNPSAAGTGSVTVNNGAALETGYFSNQSISKSVTLNDGSTLSVTRPDDSFITVANSGQITWTDPITLGGTGGTVDTNAGDGTVPGLTVAGGITGTGDLTLSADSERLLVVNSALSHSGNTAIDGGGTVALESSTSISSPVVSLANESTLDVTGTTSGTLALASQFFGGTGTVAGNVTTASTSTIRVGGVAAGLPTVTTGLELNYDASQDAPADGDWSDESATAGSITLDFANGVSTPVTVSDPTFTALTAAYDISTSGAAIAPGADNAYFDARGLNNGTFEVVFNVTNTTAGNEQVLLDIGGGRGVAITLDGNTFTAGVNGDATDTTSFNTTLSTGWHHAVVVIEDTDPADGSDDIFTVYVNNSVVGTSSTVDIDDYAGSNGWSIGGTASVALDPTQLGVGAPTLSSPIDFHGQIAIARYYQTAFSVGDVDTNFNALQGDPFVDVDTLTIEGNLTLDNTSTLEIDIFNATLGSDLLNVTGDLTADGVLDISLVDTVADGDTFDILDFGSISGSFDSINLPALAAGLGWDTSNLLIDGTISVTTASVIEGDYDGSGVVAQGDLDIVLLNWGTSNFTGDPNAIPGGGPFDGSISQNELDGVLLNWGNTALAATTVIPEPSSLVLLLVCGIGALNLRRSKEA